MPPEILYLIASAFAVMLVSLSGVVFLWRSLKGLLEGNLHYLVSFSAGVFLIVAITLGQEAIHLSPDFQTAVIALFSGFLLMYAIHLIFPESHHHHEHSCEHCGHEHTRTEALRVLISDGVHNIGDGILLSAAFLTDIYLGVITLIGILIHEMVQEISEFFVLRESGYTPSQALTRNFLVSSTILIGVGIGITFGSVQTIQAVLLGIAAGGFLYVVALDLFPASFHATRGRKGSLWKFFLAAALGALLIISINTLTGHGHEDGQAPQGEHLHTDEHTDEGDPHIHTDE